MEVDEGEIIKKEPKKRGRKPKKAIRKNEEIKETMIVLNEPIIVVFED